jgi:hypothetical protein
VETVPWLSCIGDGIERVFFSSGKQHDDLKKKTMDKTLEITWKTSINTTLPTCHDKGVFTMMRTHTGNTTLPTCHDKGVFTMMRTHTGNTSSLQCQEVGRRKGAKAVVVIWAYSVALVWLV